MLRGVAKGAKREGSPFSGGLEALTRGEVVAIVKANERSPDTLSTLTAWDLQETFPAARRSLAAFYAGLYMLDLVYQSVRDSDPHPGLFDGLLRALRHLESPGDEAMGVAWFQWMALRECGFTPELDRDVMTQAPLVKAPIYAFSAARGGFTSDGFAGRDGAGGDFSHPGALWRVRAGTIEFLRGLDRSPGVPDRATTPPSEIAGSDGRQADLSRANRFLAMYFRSVLGRWPPAVHAVFPGIAAGESRAGP